MHDGDAGRLPEEEESRPTPAEARTAACVPSHFEEFCRRSGAIKGVCVGQWCACAYT